MLSVDSFSSRGRCAARAVKGGAIYAQAAREIYSDCDIMGNSGRSGAGICK